MLCSATSAKNSPVRANEENDTLRLYLESASPAYGVWISPYPLALTSQLLHTAGLIRKERGSPVRCLTPYNSEYRDICRIRYAS